MRCILSEGNLQEPLACDQAEYCRVLAESFLIFDAKPPTQAIERRSGRVEPTHVHELPLGRGPGNVQRVSADFSMTTGYSGIIFSTVNTKRQTSHLGEVPTFGGDLLPKQRKNTRSIRWRSAVPFCRGTGDQAGKDLGPDIILVHTLMGGLLL